MDLNCSAINSNISFFYLKTPTDPFVYVSLGFFHLFFIAVPSLMISLMALKFFMKQPQNTLKLIFFWMCLFCAVSPSSYGLLMDLSLITDFPLIGRCEMKWEGAIYWLSHSHFETSLMWIIGFSAVMLYVSIHCGTITFKKKKINLALFVIVLSAFVESTLLVLLVQNHTAKSCKVRGSFCVSLFDANPSTMLALEYSRISIAFLPMIISMSASLFLYWRKIKKSSIEFDAFFTKSLAYIVTFLLIGTFIWTLPTAITFLLTYYGERKTFIHFMGSLLFQINYPFFPVLIIALHKDQREKLIAEIRGIIMVLCPREVVLLQAEQIGNQDITIDVPMMILAEAYRHK